MRAMKKFRIDGLLRRLRAENGNTAVEFGLMLPAILLVLLAAVELGRYGAEMNRITNAARAGMQYAIQGQGYAKATDFIIDAVRADAGDTTNSLTVTTRWYCRCTAAAEVDCTSTCVDDNYPQMYVTIAVSETFEALFPLLAANPSFALPVNYSPAVVTTSRVR